MPLSYVPGAGKQSSSVAFEKATEKAVQQGLSERQLRLNQLYSWYTTNQYDNRKIDFDGGEYMDPLAREAIVTGSYLPPGFYDVGQQYPVRYRRPLAPYNLVRVIVDRFNELLFSHNRAPRVKVLGDSKTEDYLQAIIEVTDFWGKMLQARKLGGAMGSVAVGFQFIDGKPRVEVHDPRWCFPDFEDRAEMTLNLLEKRWIFHKEERVQDGKGGWKWGKVAYWYRRIISKDKDIVFKSVAVREGEEPLWEIDLEKSVEHHLGFCPVVWIQNHEVLDSIDGESDCHGVYDQVEQMDLLNSMAIRGIILNCDPTPVVKEDKELNELLKGSDNTVKLTKGGSFEYVEISGNGPKAAFEAAKGLKESIQEVVQVFLPPPDGAGVPKTATEVERTMSTMLAKADLLRKQYGGGSHRLLRMILKAAKRMQEAKPGEDGVPVRRYLKLPPRVTETPEGGVQITRRELGGGGHLKLVWPKFFEPTLGEIKDATSAAGEAKDKGLIDAKHASEFVAPMYHVENVAQMMKEMEEKAKADAEAAQAQMGAFPPAY